MTHPTPEALKTKYEETITAYALIVNANSPPEYHDNNILMTKIACRIGSYQAHYQMLHADHLKLVAENAKLKADLRSLERKADHGCYGFNCDVCDGVACEVAHESL